MDMENGSCEGISFSTLEILEVVAIHLSESVRFKRMYSFSSALRGFWQISLIEDLAFLPNEEYDVTSRVTASSMRFNSRRSESVMGVRFKGGMMERKGSEIVTEVICVIITTLSVWQWTIGA